ncbi:MAG: HD-like signal output (HDOD) protein, partial [Myxococcota bacterium]
VMKTVNSAAFGMRRPITSISQAVTLLGRSRLESLVVALAVRDQLPKHVGSVFQADRFWLAASRRAAVARGLAELLHPQTRSESFVAGLLQDMAVPLLAAVRADTYGPLLQHWHGDTESRLEELEKTEFGWDHGEVGASMGHHWELPTGLVQSIDGHHAGEGAQPAVHLVSFIRETDEQPGVDELVSVCEGEYNLAADDVTAAVGQAFEDATELAKLFC